MSNEKILVEPTTVVAIAKVAYAAWQAYQQNRKEQQELELLRAIDRKLDKVLDNQVDIIKRLEELKTYIDGALERQSIRQLTNKAEAYRSNLNVVNGLISTNRNAAVPRIKELELPTRTFCFELMRMGFSAFVLSVPAAILHLAVLDTLERVGGEQKKVIDRLELEFLDEWEAIFSSWLDVEKPEGIAHAAKLLRENRERWESEIDNTQRKYDLGWTKRGSTRSGDTTCDYYERKWLTISGDKFSGFSDKITYGPQSKKENCSEPARVNPNKVIDWDVHEKEMAKIFDYHVDDKNTNPDQSIEMEEYDIANRILEHHNSGKMLAANHQITRKLKQARKNWMKAVKDEAQFAEFVVIAMQIRKDVVERKIKLKP